MEYLKGAGASRFTVTVPVGGESYATEEEAALMASSAISGRTTAWDKRQAILFLRLPPDSMPPEDDTRWWLSLLPPQDPDQQDFLFAGMRENPGDYALHTSNPVWLPAKEESVESDVLRGSELFLIGPVEEDGSHPEMSLSTLRVAVTASLADWAEGEFIGSLSGVVTYDGPQAIPGRSGPPR